MELLQIIIFSIKLFALIASIIVLSSYLVYKLKDRKRNKPYAKVAVQPLNVLPPVHEIQYSLEEYKKVLAENVSPENIQYDNVQNDIQYQRVQYVSQPMPVYQNNQPRSFGQRFKILNEDNNSFSQRQPLIERLQPVTAAPQKFNTARQAQVFNIYDYYSSNNFEPMHKIKS